MYLEFPRLLDGKGSVVKFGASVPALPVPTWDADCGSHAS